MGKDLAILAYLICTLEFDGNITKEIYLFWAYTIGNWGHILIKEFGAIPNI